MKHKPILASAMLLISANTLAADVNIRGFASIVAGQTLDSDASLYGYDDSINFKQDSLFALQFDANLQENLSATMQVMSRGRDEFDTNVEWAYLSYKFTDEVTLNAGRIRVPFYRYSDFLDVRYTYPWVRMPATVYGFEFPGYDGLSLVHRTMLGSWDSTFQVVYGHLEGNLPGTEVHAEIDNLAGFNWTMSRDWLTLRAGYVDSKSSIDIPEYDGLIALVNGMGAATGTDLTYLADGIEIDGDSGDFFGVGVGIDYNNVLLDAEYISYAVEDSLTPDTKAWFFMAGYRFGRLTPYVTYSKSSAEGNSDIASQVPQALADIPIEQAGNATLQQLLAGAVAATNQDIALSILGVRYDFHNSAALKAEFTSQDADSQEKVQLLRLSVDLVF